RQRLRGSVEGAFPGGHATLVGDGDQRGPDWRAGAGAADFLPAGVTAVGKRVVDGEPGIGIGVEGDVGGAACAGDLDVFLPGRFVFDDAEAAGGAAPGGLGAVGSAAGQCEGRPPHCNDVGRAGGPEHAGEAPAVTGGGDEGDALMVVG